MILKTYEYKGCKITWEKHSSMVEVSNGGFGYESFYFYCGTEKFLTLSEAKRHIDGKEI